MLTSGPLNPGEALWLRIRLLLVGLVVCRGLVLLCVMPPFEGWDEYQHVGYVEHVRTTGRAAVFGETMVSTALLAGMVEFPHGRSALEQVGWLGAVGHPTYWTRGEASGVRAIRLREISATVPLYQAQHGSLYYRLAAPLFATLGGTGDLRWSVGGLRLANLILTAVAVWIALGAVGRLLRSERDAALVGLLIATQPLFLMNGVRVANDALGVMLATAAIAGTLALDGRRVLVKGVALGALVGLAIAAKAVHFGLVPFVGVCWLMVMMRERTSKGRSVLSAFALTSGCLAVVGPELGWNLAHHGMLSPMQEAVKNRADGRTTADLIAAALHLNWRVRLSDLWLRTNLLAGGWSFLGTSPRWVMRYTQLVLAGLIGWIWVASAWTRPRPSPFRSVRGLVGCVVLCLGYTAALGYHMAQSQLAWGVPTTNPWYACAATPWFLVLVAGGALCWPLGPLRPALLILLATTFVASEQISVWGAMVTTYSGGAGGMEAFGRLARLQPPLFGTATLLAAGAGVPALFGVTIVLWARFGVRDPATQLDGRRGRVDRGVRPGSRPRSVAVRRKRLASAASDRLAFRRPAD